MDSDPTIFRTYKNLSTLDLILSSNLLGLMNFSPLQDLQYLRHISVRLGRTIGFVSALENPVETLFESLTLCQKAHQNLNLVSLTLTGLALPHYVHKSSALFMETWATTVKNVALNFYYLQDTEVRLDPFYAGLAQLK